MDVAGSHFVTMIHHPDVFARGFGCVHCFCGAGDKADQGGEEAFLEATASGIGRIRHRDF